MKMKKDEIDRAVASTLEVAARMGRSEPRPFFVERTMAAWEARGTGALPRARAVLPRLSLAMLLALLVLNAYTAVHRSASGRGESRDAAIEEVARGYDLGTDDDALTIPTRHGGGRHE